jgi:molecular chaperone GrpE (heat shock protein)
VFQWKGKALSTGVTNTPADEGVLVSGAAEAHNTPSIEAPASISTQNLELRLERMFEDMEEMHALVVRLSERDTHNEKAFNTLHAELGDYKKDFIYEHLKPVVRPLLFLFDSIEGFESEISSYESTLSPGVAASSTSATAGSGTMPTRLVRQNAVFFREQLVEALRICEVTPMDTPQGRPDTKHHKTIRIVPVAPEQDGLIQSVVRSGWFLNGQLLRPAEVIVGKYRG